jgi:hypothetical protein
MDLCILKEAIFGKLSCKISSVQKRVEDADFPGVCSYHGDCLEVFSLLYI